VSTADTLPTWAGRPVPPEDPPAAPPGPSAGRPRGPVVAGAAVVLLVVLVLGGRAIGGGDDGDAAMPATDGPVAPAATPEIPARPPVTDGTASPLPREAPITDAVAEQEAPTPEAPPEAVDPARIAVFRGGKVHLEGRIASRAEADEIVAKAAAVVGPDNVVDEYVIDPSVPYIDSAPLYVEDRVLFAFGSDRIEADFVPLLELGMILLQQNPQVTITVVGHTDSSGSAEFNQVLSERRVANVIRYFTDRGISPTRFTPDARGQSDPLVPTGDGQREAGNRRVEFIITGLLDG
jgi:outer membrane protein OmpA-like peptidoglycan-associated protein